MVQVALDSGPLHGQRTGVGNAVAWTLDALRNLQSGDTARPIDITAYVTSMRAKVQPGERRLPLPAAAAHRLWAKSSAIPMDRWLGSPDVVHGTNYVVPPARVPRIVTVYDCWFLAHPEAANPVFVRAGAALRRAVNEGATVVTSSNATTDEVRRLLGVDATTVHLGPPPPIMPPADRPVGIDPVVSEQPFVLAIGTAERRKNLPLLVDAFAQLGAEHEHVRLVIAGRDGDDALAIARSIDRLTPQIRQRVHRLLDVDEPTKSWLLHHAAALAYPSLDEGFGFPILEAQHAGTPVVASSAGSIPEISGPAALLSLPSDSGALAANLHWAVTSERQRERLIRLGHRNVERFSWASTGNALRDLYHDVVNRS